MRGHKLKVWWCSEKGASLTVVDGLTDASCAGVGSTGGCAGAGSTGGCAGAGSTGGCTGAGRLQRLCRGRLDWRLCSFDCRLCRLDWRLCRGGPGWRLCSFDGRLCRLD